jgi:hypothetical protein
LSIVSEGLYVARPSGYASEVRPGRAEDKDLGFGARVDARAILLSTIVEVLSFANQKSRLKTMQSIIKVGQRFKFTVLTDDAPTERQGVVIRVLSNREEGLGLDVDQYMSYWVEAHELPETESSTTLVFVRSTDGKVYLDGKVTDVTLLP